MPTFTVKSPDGKTYKVNGPEGSTAAQAQAQVQRHIKANPPLSTMDTLQGAAGRFADGFFPGSAAATRGVRGVIDNAANSVFHGAEFSPSKAYTKYAREQQRIDKKFAQDHPTAASAAGWTGFGASFALPGVRAVNAERSVATGAARLAARGSVPASVIARDAVKRRAVAAVANNAATGAVMGTAAGALQGEGTDRITNAVAGGVSGTAMGAVATPVVAAASKLGGGILRAVAPHVSTEWGERSVQRAAERRVNQAIEPHYTPTEAAAENARRVDIGLASMPADLTDGTRQLTGSTGRGLGPGQSRVREAIAERQRNMAGRTQNHIAGTLGDTVNPHAQSAALTAAGRDASRPLYDEAYQHVPTITPEIREFMDSRQGRSAVSAGVDDIANTPSSRRNVGSEEPMRPGITWDPELDSYRSGQVPAMEALDGAKRHLDNIVYDGQNRFVAQSGTGGTNTRPAELQRQELLEQLDAQNPAYGRARAAYAGPIQERQAFETGRQSLQGTKRSNVNDGAAQMEQMNPGQLNQMRLGDRTRLSEAVGDSKPYADATAPIAGTNNRTALIRQIHGPEAAERLDGLVAGERDGHLTFKEVFGNSKTSDRNAVDEDISAEALMDTALQAATASPWGAFKAATKGAWNASAGKADKALKTQMGEMLTETDPQRVTDFMQDIDRRIATDARFKSRVGRVTASLSKTGVVQGVGNSGDRTGIYDDE